MGNWGYFPFINGVITLRIIGRGPPCRIFFEAKKTPPEFLPRIDLPKWRHNLKPEMDFASFIIFFYEAFEGLNDNFCWSELMAALAVLAVRYLASCHWILGQFTPAPSSIHVTWASANAAKRVLQSNQSASKINLLIAGVHDFPFG